MQSAQGCIFPPDLCVQDMIQRLNIYSAFLDILNAHTYNGVAGHASSESDTELRVHKRSPGARFAEWLGHWTPEYDAMDQNELMLQVLASLWLPLWFTLSILHNK